jgi:DNA-dependent protein kinase catalytic subunit
MLMLVPVSHVIAYYQANITVIMGILKSTAPSYMQADLPLDFIEEKSCCFRLMQILYDRLPAEQVHTTKSPISTEWERSQGTSGEGRQMTIDLIRFGHKIRNQMVIYTFYCIVGISILTSEIST